MQTLPHHRSLALIFLLLLAAIPASRSLADQPATDEAPATTNQIPSDGLQRETPRSAMQGFLAAIEEDDYELAARRLDMRFMPFIYRRFDGPELARMLDFVISRRLTIDLGGLSDEPEGDLADGLPRTREELGVIHMDGEDITLYLQRAPSKEGVLVWKVSSVTMARIADLYDDLEYPPLVQWFQKHIPEGNLLGLEYFKWVLILLAMIIAYPIAYILGLLLTRILSKKGAPLHPRLRTFLTRPIAALLVFLVGRWVLLDLGMGVEAQRVAGSHTLILLVSTWVAISGISLFRDALTVRLQKRDRLATTVLLRPLANSIKVIVALSALLIWLDNVGYNITTLLAGLGVGGLAIALALQKPLEDLFGAVTLFTQQPVKVHDFCKFGTTLGTVEEIGLRSSRIRTLENTVITVPNARIANEYIENISQRKMIRYKTEIRLAYNTSAPQLRSILEATRAMLESESRLVEGKKRARLKRLGRHGFIIEVLAYADTSVWAEYLEVAEALNLGITEIVAEAGANFAAPVDAGV